MAEKLPRPKKQPAPDGTGTGNVAENPAADPAPAPADPPAPPEETPVAPPIEQAAPHPHDAGTAFATKADEVKQAFRLGSALRRMEHARRGLEGIVDGFDDEAAAAALVEYLAARDGMSDAMRAFGPPR